MGVRLVDDPSGEILIVQEILTESFDRRDVYFLKRRPYVGELHKSVAKCAPNPAKLVSLFTKSCEQNMEESGILFTSYSRGFPKRMPDVMTAPRDACASAH